MVFFIIIKKQFMGKIILSLDGGGIKGISLIMLLNKIFNLLNDENIKPYQIFDLFSGTSTGGLLAIYLGLKKKNLSKALDLYLGGNPDLMKYQGEFGLIQDLSKYSEFGVENEYKRVYGHLDKLENYKANINTPHVFVTATRSDITPFSIALFKNYNIPSIYPYTTKAYLWECARSTSAAPTYWKPYTRNLENIIEFSDDQIINVEENMKKDLEIMLTKINKGKNNLTKKINKITNLNDEIVADEKKIYNKLINYLDETEKKLIANSETTKKNKIEYLKKNSWVMVDGGIGNNNPTLVTLNEIKTIWNSYNDIDLYLSLGCGTEEFVDNKGFSEMRVYNKYKRDEKQITLLYIDALIDAFIDIITSINNLLEKNVDTILNDEITNIQDNLKKTKNKIEINKLKNQLKMFEDFKKDLELGHIDELSKNLKDDANNLSYVKGIYGKILFGLSIPNFSLNYALKNMKNVIFSENTLESTIADHTIPYISSYVLSFAPSSILKNILNIKSYFKKLKYAYNIHFIKNHIKLFKILYDGLTVDIQFLYEKLDEFLYELKMEDSKEENVILIIRSLQNVLHDIISLPIYSEMKFKDIYKQIIVQAKKLAITKIEEIESLLVGTIISSSTSTEQFSQIGKDILGNKFFRLSPHYKNKYDLAETDPLKIRKMMMEINNYLNIEEEKFVQIANLIKKNKQINSQIDPQIKINEVTESENQNQLLIIGLFIEKSIYYEKERIYKKINIKHFKEETFDIIYLKKIIDKYYRIYFEAKYALLNELRNYDKNQILTKNVNNMTFNIKYIDPNNILNAKQYSWNKLKNILEGKVLFDNKSFVNQSLTSQNLEDQSLTSQNLANQYGGEINNFDDFNKELNKVKERSDFNEIINSLIKKKEYDPFKSIDSIIFKSIIKRGDDGSYCITCSKIINGNYFEHVCQNLENENEKSMSIQYWNTCKNLSNRISGIYDNITPQFINQNMDNIDMEELKKEFNNAFKEYFYWKNNDIMSKIKLNLESLDNSMLDFESSSINVNNEIDIKFNYSLVNIKSSFGSLSISGVNKIKFVIIPFVEFDSIYMKNEEDYDLIKNEINLEFELGINRIVIGSNEKYELDELFNSLTYKSAQHKMDNKKYHLKIFFKTDANLENPIFKINVNINTNALKINDVYNALIRIKNRMNMKLYKMDNILDIGIIKMDPLITDFQYRKWFNDIPTKKYYIIDQNKLKNIDYIFSLQIPYTETKNLGNNNIINTKNINTNEFIIIPYLYLNGKSYYSEKFLVGFKIKAHLKIDDKGKNWILFKKINEIIYFIIEEEGNIIKQENLKEWYINKLERDNYQTWGFKIYYENQKRYPIFDTMENGNISFCIYSRAQF